MLRFLISVILFILVALPAYAQEPICTGPGVTQWQDAGEMEEPQLRFHPAIVGDRILIPDGPQVGRLIVGERVAIDLPVALQPVISRTNYTLHVQGNHGYLVGGSDITNTVEYATATPVLFGPWKTTAATINQHLTDYRVASSDDFLYILAYNSEVAQINPNGSLGQWQAVNLLPEYREGFAVLLDGGRIYVIGGLAVGGSNPRGALRSVRYTTLIDGLPGTWQSAPPMLLERYGPEAVIVDDYLYVIGGDELTYGQIGGHSLIERAKINQDGSLDTWEFITRLVVSRRDFGLVKAGGRVFVLGGTNEDPAINFPPGLSSVEAWDTSKPFPPTDYGVTINDGALFTNQVTTTLTIGLSAPFTQLVQVSNDGGFAGAPWQQYQPCKPWIITQYGSSILPRTVYTRFKDTAGQLSATFQDDIILDVTPPEGAVIVEELQPASLARVESVTAQDAEYTYYLPLLFKDGAEANVTLILAASDDVSGVAEMRLSTEAGGGSWQAYREETAWYLPEGGRVYVQFRDNAGNVSDEISAGR